MLNLMLEAFGDTPKGGLWFHFLCRRILSWAWGCVCVCARARARLCPFLEADSSQKK